jgi:hypothetical protein
LSTWGGESAASSVMFVLWFASGRIGIGRQHIMGRAIINKTALLCVVLGAVMLGAGMAIFGIEASDWIVHHRWEPLTATRLVERYTDIILWGASDLPSERFFYWLRNLPLERLLIGAGLVLSLLGASRLNEHR